MPIDFTKPGPLEWTCIEEKYPNAKHALPDSFTYRAPVPGGWLVATWAGSEPVHGKGGGLTFVSDPTHSWALNGRPLSARQKKGRRGP